MTASAPAPGPLAANATDAPPLEVLIRDRPSHVQQATEPLAVETRTALDLPIDRPIVMSGHQADFWHCGILAKWLTLHPIASRSSAHATWLVVDHDTNDPTSLAYPSRHDQRPIRAYWKWAGASSADASASTDDSHLPTRLRAARVPAALPKPAQCWSSSTHDAIRHARLALEANTDASNLAEQVTRAAAHLLKPVSRSLPSIIFARRLAGTPAFQALQRAMLKDPVACVQAYNAAANQFPNAGIRPLELKPERVELPVWSIRKSRRPVFATDQDCSTLDIGAADTLAPRALLLSATLRLAACDLFIHGTGGGEYDKVTDAWIAGWLIASPRGRAAADPALLALLDQRINRDVTPMAPSMVVSATARLPFPGVIVPTPAQIDHTIWLAHAARHRLLRGDHGAFDADRKRALVEAIDTARREGSGTLKPRRARAAALAAYRTLHSALAASRAEHQAALAELERAASEARMSRGLASVVHDRTWPFVLHSHESLLRLRTAVEAAL